jgi:arylsulfatase A-like enzyme
MRKFVPWMLNLVGIMLLAFSLAADRLGFGGPVGLGLRQILFLVLGALLILSGIFLALPKGRQLTDRTIRRLESPQAGSRTPRETLIDCLVMGVWFGLVTGLVEGVALWLFKLLGWSGGIYSFLGNSLQILWISTGFDLLFFGVIGLLVGLIAVLFRRLPISILGIYLFTFLMLFDWFGIILQRWVDVFGLITLIAGLAIWPARWLIRKQEIVLNFWRRSLLVIAIIGLLVFVLIQGGFWLREEITTSLLPKVPKESPNILIIIVDTLRADHLSVYGYPRDTSPNIDELVKRGSWFEHTISPSSWTKPAHASLVTGLYPAEHGTDSSPLDEKYFTIGEALSEYGYRTAVFSANIDVFSRLEGFDQGIIHFEDHYESLSDIAVSSYYGRFIEFYLYYKLLGNQLKIGRRSASHITQSALDWLTKDPDKPFFVMLNYFDVHDPYVPPEPFRSIFATTDEPGGLINTDWDMDHVYQSMTPEQLQGEIDAYDGAIAYVDENIGQFISEMQKQGLLNNTILVVTSDHGEMFGEHGLLHHANSLYQEIIHVPLIFIWPDHIPSGKRISLPVSLASLPATLMELVDIDHNRQFPGPSLVALWEKNGSESGWAYPLSEAQQMWWVPPQQPTFKGAMESIITPQWHYITHETLGEELYDWVNDPAEENNLINEAGLESEINQLRDYLDEFIATRTN